MTNVTILNGDCRDVLQTLPEGSINMCVTSPPYYGLRNYGDQEKQIGLEQTPEEYIAQLVEVFREVRRTLRDDGTLWVNIGDSYYNYRSGEAFVKQSVAKTKQDLPSFSPSRNNKLAGLKSKDLIGIPWMLAFALRADGWYLRQDIIWHKPNPMPESVKDRCTKAHEYIFLLSKSKNYYFDYEAIREPAVTAPVARNKAAEGYQADYPNGDRFSEGERVWGEDNKRMKRSVWTVNTKPYKEAHFATFPTELVEPAILAGCPKGGMVLDPFGGSGTTGYVADKLGRNATLIELNPSYIEIAENRIDPPEQRLDSNLFEWE
jgi:DNA modification methylase